MIRVVIRAAGGPRRGYGHLVRCRRLADALGARPVLSVRGGREAERVAVRLGLRIIRGGPAQIIAREAPDLVLVDDPNHSAAELWCRAARRLRTPVASVHDLGLGRCTSDLEIDGSIRPLRARRGVTTLTGPRYAIVDPGLLRLRGRRPAPARPCVLVALGGGARAGLAWALGRRIAVARPDVDVRVAGGFVAARRRTSLPNLYWLAATDGLAHPLANATVALVAGGVTLYETCCLGVPAVATAVVPAQRPTIAAFAARHAIVDGGSTRNRTRAVRGVLALLEDAPRRDALGRRASREIDGRGVWRVAAALERLAGAPKGRGR